MKTQTKTMKKIKELHTELKKKAEETQKLADEFPEEDFRNWYRQGRADAYADAAMRVELHALKGGQS